MTPFTLSPGPHDDTDGTCVMEYVAILAGEDKNAHPECVCPSLHGLCWAINDLLLDDDQRERVLAAFIPRLMGSSDGREREREDAIRHGLGLLLTYVPPTRRLRHPVEYADARDAAVTGDAFLALLALLSVLPVDFLRERALALLDDLLPGVVESEVRERALTMV